MLIELLSSRMDCCNCFEFFRRKHFAAGSKPFHPPFTNHLSQEHLLCAKSKDSPKAAKLKSVASINCFRASLFPVEDGLDTSGSTVEIRHEHTELKTDGFSSPANGCARCKPPLKFTYRAVRRVDADGNKMINEYVKVCLIGNGSYGKVVLHRSLVDGQLYAIKIFHKSRLRKIRVGPSQTAMTDVLREVEIMKRLDHSRIVGLVEVIDDPDSDHFYMVLEYVEGRRIFEGSGPPGGIGEANAQRYFRDVVEGLMYLHKQNVIHGDIKPENLLLSSDGHIKIGDFSVSQTFEGNNDEVQRSPGTPVFTAPECCSGSAYHGKAADVWALGVTLFCMLFGSYPFIGDSLQDVYDKIVHKPLQVPEVANQDAANLIEGLLLKDPNLRFTLNMVAQHPWVVQGFGPVIVK